MALVPGKSEGISINTINSGVAGASAIYAPAASWDATNSSLYIDNAGANAGPYLQYDGRTKLLTVSAPVTAGVTYSMKIAIGDSGDNNLDSAVFFKNQGFLALTSASDNAYATAENKAVSGNVITDNTGSGVDLAPDGTWNGISVTSVNGIAIGASPITLASGANVLMHANGTFSYDPTGSAAAQALLIGQSLTDNFTYTEIGPDGQPVKATVHVTVTNTDHPPVAVADSFNTVIGSAVKIHVLANDSDPDNDPLTVTQVAGHTITAGGAAVAVTGGSVTLDAVGDLRFTPTTGYVGTPSFTYTIDDGHHGTATATVSGTVADVPPVAADDAFTTGAAHPITISVLGNDSSPVGLPLTITKIGGTAIAAGGAAVSLADGHGTVALSAAGTLTYTPTAGFAGAETFAYTISDGKGGTATANVSGTVLAPPVPVNDTFETSQGVAVTIPVLANDTDPNSLALTVTKVGSTAITAGGAAVSVTGGSVKLDVAGELIFTPTAGYTGAPSFTYTVADTAGGTATANVNGAVYAPPVATNDTFVANSVGDGKLNYNEPLAK